MPWSGTVLTGETNVQRGTEYRKSNASTYAVDWDTVTVGLGFGRPLYRRDRRIEGLGTTAPQRRGALSRCEKDGGLGQAPFGTSLGYRIRQELSVFLSDPLAPDVLDHVLSSQPALRRIRPLRRATDRVR